MGRCEVCNGPTRYNYPLCRLHYYFNLNEGRFWVAFFLTVLTELIIQLPILSEEGVLLLAFKLIVQEINSPLLWLLYALMNIALFILALMYWNDLVYKHFFSKKRIKVYWHN